MNFSRHSIKNILKHSIIVAVMLVGMGSASFAHAQTQDTHAKYEALAPLELSDNQKIRTDLSGFIIDGFRIAVAASAALAVIMIIYGGIQYLSTDVVFKKGDARKTIEQALIGLLLVMSSYLILRTINPAFVNLGALTDATKPAPPAEYEYGLTMNYLDPKDTEVTTPVSTATYYSSMEECQAYQAEKEKDPELKVLHPCARFSKADKGNYVARLSFIRTDKSISNREESGFYLLECQDNVHNIQLAVEAEAKKDGVDRKFTVVQPCTKQATNTPADTPSLVKSKTVSADIVEYTYTTKGKSYTITANAQKDMSTVDVNNLYQFDELTTAGTDVVHGNYTQDACEYVRDGFKTHNTASSYGSCDKQQGLK